MSERMRPRNIEENLKKEQVSTPEVAELQDGRKIIDISEKQLLEIFDAQDLKSLLTTVVKEGKGALSQSALVEFFVQKSNTSEALQTLLDERGWSESEFENFLQEKVVPKFKEILEDWVETAENTFVESQISWKDKYNAGWQNRIIHGVKTAMPTALKVGALSMGMRALTASFGVVNAWSAFASGATAGVGAKYFSEKNKKNEIAKQKSKQVEDTYQLKLDERRQEIKNSYQSKEQLKDLFDSQSPVALAGIISEIIRSESNQDINGEEDVSTALIRETIHSTKHENEHGELLTSVENLSAKISQNQSEGREKLGEMASKNPKLVAAMGKILEVKRGDLGEDKERLGIAVAATIGGTIAAGVMFDSSVRSASGALIGGYLGVKYGQEKNLEAQKELFVKEVKGKINIAEKALQIYENSEQQEGVIEILGRDDGDIRMALQLGLLNNFPALQYRAKNLVHRIDAYEMNERLKHSGLEGVLEGLYQQENEVNETAQAFIKKVQKKSTGRIIKYGLIGAVGGAGVMQLLGSGAKLVAEHLNISVGQLMGGSSEGGSGVSTPEAATIGVAIEPQENNIDVATTIETLTEPVEVPNNNGPDFEKWFTVPEQENVVPAGDRVSTFIDDVDKLDGQHDAGQSNGVDVVEAKALSVDQMTHDAGIKNPDTIAQVKELQQQFSSLDNDELKEYLKLSVIEKGNGRIHRIQDQLKFLSEHLEGDDKAKLHKMLRFKQGGRLPFKTAIAREATRISAQRESWVKFSTKHDSMYVVGLNDKGGFGLTYDQTNGNNAELFTTTKKVAVDQLVSDKEVANLVDDLDAADLNALDQEINAPEILDAPEPIAVDSSETNQLYVEPEDSRVAADSPLRERIGLDTDDGLRDVSREQLADAGNRESTVSQRRVAADSPLRERLGLDTDDGLRDVSREQLNRASNSEGAEAQRNLADDSPLKERIDSVEYDGKGAFDKLDEARESVANGVLDHYKPEQLAQYKRVDNALTWSTELWGERGKGLEKYVRHFGLDPKNEAVAAKMKLIVDGHKKAIDGFVDGTKQGKSLRSLESRVRSALIGAREDIPTQAQIKNGVTFKKDIYQGRQLFRLKEFFKDDIDFAKKSGNVKIWKSMFGK